MGMHIDLRPGQSIIASVRGDESCRVKITLERKQGTQIARLLVEADQRIALVPPNAQQKITPP